MSTTITSLWPEDIKVDVLPPVAILRIQAVEIGRITRGILQGQVSTVTGLEDFVAHRLDLIAPALDGRRYGVLNATHRADIYPVVVEADCFRPSPKRVTIADLVAQGSVANLAGLTTTVTPPEWPSPGDWRPVASNQDEFVGRVREVLKSSKVRSAIDSLIALSNERPTDGKAVSSDPAA